MDGSGFIARSFSYDTVPDSVLFDLYGMRKRVFYERLNWKVHVQGDHEVDQYDDANADYVILSYRSMPVAGVRMISTLNPYMANGVFSPYFSQPLPCQADIIESSRFFVDKGRVQANGLSSYPLTPMLLKSMVDYAQANGAVTILTIVSKPMARIVKNAGCLYEVYGIGHISEREPLYLINIEVTPANLASLSQSIEARWPRASEPFRIRITDD